eukprot:TRINITY_DN2530_c0_g2_i5.p2 TRINITY_DN2530_c0_g2~~TRINITY_DN2530_c0_g2_i5.p2  ORF type:complete len:111 (-),score=41.62 TRINITY_DN2530_c0_g2_i5:159-491(-)
MIMVSHDLNLKNYAHRVVRIADGKIVGEEFINPEVRERHISDLYERINNPSKEKLTIREGADYENENEEKDHQKEAESRFPVKANAATVLRTSEDYKIIRMVNKKRNKIK